MAIFIALVNRLGRGGYHRLQIGMGRQFLNAVLSYTLILSPAAGLRARTSFSGLATNRLIDLNDINSFGFGYASHSLIPVLRVELRNPEDETNGWWSPKARLNRR